MEIFRRLGLAANLRGAGLPADYPNDVASRTTATGIELCRIGIPSRAERYGAIEGPKTSWPTPEPPHRINQIYFEPYCSRMLQGQPRIPHAQPHGVRGFHAGRRWRHGRCPRCRQRRADSRLPASFLIGCDGGKSTVRKRISAQLSGHPGRATRAIDLHSGAGAREPTARESAHGCTSRSTRVVAGPRSQSMGAKTWLIHNFLYREEPQFDSVDRDWLSGRSSASDLISNMR